MKRIKIKYRIAQSVPLLGQAINERLAKYGIKIILDLELYDKKPVKRKTH